VRYSISGTVAQTMPIDVNALEKAIKRAIPVTHLEIEDQSSGCGENYAIVLVSEVNATLLSGHDFPPG